jgi:hypothetical protein
MNITTHTHKYASINLSSYTYMLCMYICTRFISHIYIVDDSYLLSDQSPCHEKALFIRSLYTCTYICTRCMSSIYVYIYIVATSSLISLLAMRKLSLSQVFTHRSYDDDDVYLDKLQTRGIKKSILYM